MSLGMTFRGTPFCLRRNWPKQCDTRQEDMEAVFSREELRFVQSNSDTRGERRQRAWGAGVVGDAVEVTNTIRWVQGCASMRVCQKEVAGIMRP